jgi:hypothetical protein
MQGQEGKRVQNIFLERDNTAKSLNLAINARTRGEMCAKYLPLKGQLSEKSQNLAINARTRGGNVCKISSFKGTAQRKLLI